MGQKWHKCTAGTFVPFRDRYICTGGTFVPYRNGTFLPPKKTFLFIIKKKVEFRFDPYKAVFKRILKLDEKNGVRH